MELSVHTHFAHNFDTLFRANLSKMACQGITHHPVISLPSFSSAVPLIFLSAEQAFLRIY